MPSKVVGADGRVIAENLGDEDAHVLARTVHENTGELVTLVPLIHDGEAYVADPDQSRTVGALPVEETEVAPETEEETDAEAEAEEAELPQDDSPPPPAEEEPPVEDPVEEAPAEETPAE